VATIVPMTPRKLALDLAAFADWRAAKREAARLALLLEVTLLQAPNGKPRACKGGATKDFRTWLACASWLLQLARDRRGKLAG
jgi:hypothetical protein